MRWMWPTLVASKIKTRAKELQWTCLLSRNRTKEDQSLAEHKLLSSLASKTSKESTSQSFPIRTSPETKTTSYRTTTTLPRVRTRISVLPGRSSSTSQTRRRRTPTGTLTSQNLSSFRSSVSNQKATTKIRPPTRTRRRITWTSRWTPTTEWTLPCMWAPSSSPRWQQPTRGRRRRTWRSSCSRYRNRLKCKIKRSCQFRAQTIRRGCRLSAPASRRWHLARPRGLLRG